MTLDDIKMAIEKCDDFVVANDLRQLLRLQELSDNCELTTDQMKIMDNLELQLSENGAL